MKRVKIGLRQRDDGVTDGRVKFTIKFAIFVNTTKRQVGDGSGSDSDRNRE